MLGLDTLEENDIQAAADSLFLNLNTAWELQGSVNNEDAADWLNHSVVSTLKKILTDQE